MLRWSIGLLLIFSVVAVKADQIRLPHARLVKFAALDAGLGGNVQTGEKLRQDLTCQEAVTRLEAYRQRVNSHRDQILSHLDQLALELKEDHSLFVPWEGGTHEVPIGTFDRLSLQAEDTYGFLESIYDASQVFDQTLVELMEVLPSCLERMPELDRKALLHEMKDYNNFARENESVTAEFLRSVAERMDDWHGKWGKLEGQTATFEKGHFADIIAKAVDVTESEQYVRGLWGTGDQRVISIIAELKKFLDTASALR